MVNQDEMGKSINILKSFLIFFVDRYRPRNARGAWGLNGHIRRIPVGGMDNADGMANKGFRLHDLSSHIFLAT